MADALRYLGLARKAGRLVYGMDTVEQNLRKCTAILLANDAGEAVSRNARFLAGKAGLAVVTLPYDKEQIGHAVGKALCAVCALTDKGLTEALLKAIPSGIDE